MVTLFEATVAMPGYLPIADERFFFHTAAKAWAFLADERRSDEDAAAGDPDYVISDSDAEYSDYVVVLDYIASGDHIHGNAYEVNPTSADGTGVLWAPSPGNGWGEHDLGLNYAVSVWPHADGSHHLGSLYDCSPCEWTCHCEPDYTMCVHCALVLTGEEECEDDECVSAHEMEEKS